jgi:hypothetical protein
MIVMSNVNTPFRSPKTVLVVDLQAATPDGSIPLWLRGAWTASVATRSTFEFSTTPMQSVMMKWIPDCPAVSPKSCSPSGNPPAHKSSFPVWAIVL